MVQFQTAWCRSVRQGVALWGLVDEGLAVLRHRRGVMALFVVDDKMTTFGDLWIHGTGDTRVRGIRTRDY